MTLSLPDSFFRTATNPMWVFDDESLQVLEVNEAACGRYGYSHEEFLRMTLLDIRSPEEQELFKNRGAHKGRVWEHRTKAGDILFIQGYEFPFENEGRTAILAMIVDVTERVKLERERTELLERYQILSEAANDLLWDWDLRTGLITHNEALITQYGYGRPDLIQPISWWSDKIHPDDYSIAAWSIQEAIRARQRYWTSEYRFRKADGTYVLVLDRGILQSDENDNPLRMIGSIVDLTTRRAAEDERNQLFRLSSDCILFLDPGGAINQANGAFYHLAGIDPDLGGRRNMRDLLSPEDRIVFDEAVKKALADGLEGHFSTSIATEACRDRTIQWGLITNEHKNRLFLIGRDITESNAARQNLEDALVRSQELAIEAQAARHAQTEFLQNMSHELRTPMNGMLGTAQLLASSAHDDRQRTLATILINSGESLLQILNDILDFSKIESGKITLDEVPFRLSEAIQVVFDLFSLSADQKDLVLTTHISPKAAAYVVGDQFRLRQVVSNLVGNAIKFTDKGSIDLSLEVENNAENRLEAIIRVHDTGIGIPEDMQLRIFDRFVQVDSSPTRKHGGTGLGLSISRTVIELMGGMLGVESTVGKGSVFTIRIPFAVAPPPEHRADREIAAPVTSKPGTRVLIAEDVEINAMILTSWLEERGFECVTVETGYKAIQALSQEAFDGAFVDLHMPGASGYDVVHELRRSEDDSLRRMPVIAVTASVSLEEKLRCLSEGFDDYIPKPILVAELDRVVSRLF
jgi:PAS domain S-box-containing protein